MAGQNRGNGKDQEGETEPAKTTAAIAEETKAKRKKPPKAENRP
jgi:hypothetical protein